MRDQEKGLDVLAVYFYALHMKISLHMKIFSKVLRKGHYTLKVSRVKSRDFFSCDETSQDFSRDKCVSCNFTKESFPRVMKKDTISLVNQR